MVPLLSPYGEGEIHRIEQGVGSTVLFLCCSLASPLCSLRGVMDRGSSSSWGVPYGLEGFTYGSIVFHWCSFGVPLVSLSKSKGFQ